jgi:hypothetical protein
MMMKTNLSPATQAVLDAFENASDGEYVEGVWVVNERTMLAAALRAAADQVVPEQACQIYGLTQRENERQQVREELLAIAAELEDLDD